MTRRVRNELDSGPAEEGAIVTYSRLSRRGGRGSAERQEPFIEAREVPLTDDLRAYDPERAAGAPLDGPIDDLAEPRRGRRRRGGFGAVILGAIALAAGMVILAYAYGIATRVDVPSGAVATTPDDAGPIRATLPADDAARSVPIDGNAPAAPEGDAAAALPAAQSPAEPPKPHIRSDQTANAPAAASEPAGSDGVPMDGDFALPSGGAQPALVAPVPATVTPPAPAGTEKAATPAPVAPAPAKAASANPADTKPTATKPPGSGDDLMANIERLLQRDGAAGQPGDGAAASSGPMPLVVPPGTAQPGTSVGADGLPLLPDPNGPVALTPPADVAPQQNNRLTPPADIPNVAPGTGAQ